MRDDQKATNGLRLALHMQKNNAAPTSAPPRSNGREHLAQRVIASLRRGGLGCCLTLGEDETLH
jgi:hypothetical protein